jgi:hypothetical protein
MSVELNSTQRRLVAYGLTPNASKEDIQEKIQDLTREVALLSLWKERLSQNINKEGQQVGRLNGENGYMDLEVNSVRRFVLRASLQLKAFISGSSLTANKHHNQAVLSYIDPKHSATVTEYSQALQKHAKKDLQIAMLEEMLEA